MRPAVWVATICCKHDWGPSPAIAFRAERLCFAHEGIPAFVSSDVWDCDELIACGNGRFVEVDHAERPVDFGV
jgi:hypothetical protein